jgi:hypothetical protein
MLHIVKMFQYLLHAIDFVNARQRMFSRSRQCVLAAERTQVEVTSMAEVRNGRLKRRKSGLGEKLLSRKLVRELN